MNKILIFITFSFVLGVTGCASVVKEYELPNQSLDAPLPEGKTRVIFYNGNGFNPLFLDGSWRIGIKLDGKGIENLHIKKYVQLFLQPKAYELELSHIDIFKFRNTYVLDVGNQPLYIKAYNTPISTKYKLETGEPEALRDYQPANKAFNSQAKPAGMPQSGTR